MAFFWLAVILGINIPLSILLISKADEASGVVVPMPTCAKAREFEESARSSNAKRFIYKNLHMNLNLKVNDIIIHRHFSKMSSIVNIKPFRFNAFNPSASLPRAKSRGHCEGATNGATEANRRFNGVNLPGGNAHTHGITRTQKDCFAALTMSTGD